MGAAGNVKHIRDGASYAFAIAASRKTYATVVQYTEPSNSAIT